MGEEAERFLALLERAGQSWWQLLPIHPPGPGASPYQALSAFAGTALLVDARPLVEPGLLVEDEVRGAGLSSRRRIDYAGAFEARARLLRRAFERFQANPRNPFAQAHERFLSEAGAWLEDWALFAALKRSHDGAPWTRWDAELRDREAGALERARRDLDWELAYERFVQFLFHEQWTRLREGARSRGIRLLGDLPLYVAADSADVWTDRELYDLDEEGRPSFLSGTPPDDFNPAGQVWGHPTVRWERVAERDHAPWIARVRRALELFDAVRLDHFIGYARPWRIPAPEREGAHRKDGGGGEHVQGPGEALFRRAEEELGGLPFVAEDLGDVTAEVLELRDALGLPGMHVLQFAFGAEQNAHWPHAHRAHALVYTGTHDNDTARGWADSLEDDSAFRAYSGGTGEEPHWDLVRLALTSVARTAIVPAQDLLGLGSEARMNRPGKARGNWRFRLRRRELDDSLIERLAGLTALSGRSPRVQASADPLPGRESRAEGDPEAGPEPPLPDGAPR